MRPLPLLPLPPLAAADEGLASGDAAAARDADAEGDAAAATAGEGEGDAAAAPPLLLLDAVMVMMGAAA